MKRNSRTNVKRNSASRKRAGMTMIETGFAIVIGLVVVAGAIAGYKKLYIPMKGDAAYSQAASVINAIERTKMTNSGVYPIGAAANLSTIPVLENEMGGAANSVDVAAWTYDCAAGSGQTITLTTTTFDDLTVSEMAAAKISNALAPWVAADDGAGVITMTLNNVTCN